MPKAKKKNTNSTQTTPAMSPTTVTELLQAAQRPPADSEPDISTKLGPAPAVKRPSPSQYTDLHSHLLWHRVQTLSLDLHVFMTHEYHTKNKKIRKDSFYRILVHFNPATKHRVNHLKLSLETAFKTELLPKLQPFILPAPPAPPSPMETDQDDFDPLSAPRRMLKEILQRRAPAINIPESTTIHGLRLLYKEHIDKDLVLPLDNEFTREPRVIKASSLKVKTLEQLRFALQCHAPHVFIHTTPMTRLVCVDLYILFVLEGEVAPGRLVQGYHYSIIDF